MTKAVKKSTIKPEDDKVQSWTTNDECNFILNLGYHSKAREPRLIILQRYQQAIKQRVHISFNLATVMATLLREIEVETIRQRHNKAAA
jgi:beta-glucosidase/6-phospho-beta-glucosidase/beta-galactosidase